MFVSIGTRLLPKTVVDVSPKAENTDAFWLKAPCVMYFQGGNEKEDGYYDISEGEIELYAHAETNLSGGTASWWFGGTLGTGTISGDKFTI